MKRLISLLLAVAMLLSLVPAVLADDAEPCATALEIGTPTPKNETDVDGKSVSYYEIPVSIKNNTDQTVQLTMLECYIKFDASSFKAVSYYKNEDTEVSGITYKRPVNNQTWKNEYSIINGLVTVACGMGPGLSLNDKRITVAAHGSALVFTLNLQKMDDNVESGNYAFTFAEPFEVDGLWKENMIGFKGEVEKDKTDTFYYKQRESNLDCTDTEILPITDGKAPELASVSVNRPTIEYGSTETLKLTATSTSGKDITSLVTFGVKDPQNKVVTDSFNIAADGTFTIGTHDAGTYTVWADPKEGQCTYPTTGAFALQATFEIIPKPITSATVTVTGFGKGASVSTATANVSDGLTYGNDIKWYDEKNVEVTNGNFAGSSTYKAVFTLSADSNHQLAANSTVTVNGVADEYVLSKELTAPDANGKYTVTLTLKTADKDTLAVLLLPTPSKASYGMTLKDVTLTGGTAMVYGDPNQTPVAGEFRWVDENESVGIPTVGTSEVYGRPFKLKFVPTDNVNYAELETTMRLHVYQATISIDAIKNWNYGTVIPYDGTEHTVELVIPDDTDKLYDKLTVDYTNDETNCNSATNVGKYTALAEIKVKAEESAYYAIYESDHTTRTLDWEIVQGTLSAENKTVGVRYSTPSKTLTLAELGLSALANEPGVDISFDVSGKGDVISSAGLTRDAEEKITGISLTLQDTDVNSIGKTGSVKLTITSKNYATKELTVTVEIINKDTKTLTVTGPASFPYGTTEDAIKSALTITGLPTGATPEYRFSSTGSISTAVPGSYTLTVSYEDDNNVYTGTYTFEITKLDLAKAMITSSDTLIYNGTQQTQNVTVKYNGTTIDASNYTVTGNKQTNAGRYTLTVTANADSTLYIGSKTYEFIILKAVPKTIDFSVTVPQNVTYDGQPHPATVAQTNPDLNMGGFTVSYVGIDGIVDAPVNAGEYTVSIKVKGNDNYAAVTVPADNNWKFTIAKATPTLEIETAADATYTGQPYDETSKIMLTSASTVTPNTYLYFSDAACTTSASPVNVGTYWVKAKYNGDTNHEEVTSAAKEFQITKATYTLEIKAADVTYTGAGYSESNITVTPNLKVSLAYYTNYTDGTLSGSTAAPSNAGTYYVRAHYAGDANHNSCYSNVASFKIQKATPATPPEIKVDNTDTTLGELGRDMVNKIGVPGTIHWYGPDGKPITDPHTKIEANTEYSWEFIPADGYKNNYNGIGGKTTPYVRDDLSWLPGVLGGGSSFSFHDVNRFDYYYDSVKWAADNGIASGTSRFTFSPDAVCTRAQTVTFLWRAAGSPLPRYRVSPFTDVHSYDYYYEAVLWAVEQGITTGLTATTFGPDETVTRGQVATFLYRAASAAKPNTFNPFTDVKPTAYNYGAILWAYDNRITTGTSTTTFSPDAFCTRAQIVTFLYRYYQGR